MHFRTVPSILAYSRVDAAHDRLTAFHHGVGATPREIDALETQTPALKARLKLLEAKKWQLDKETAVARFEFIFDRRRWLEADRGRPDPRTII